MTSTTCEIPLLFKDETEPVTIRDTDLIKMIPTLVRAVEGKHPNWETENTVVDHPIPVAFPRWTADFLFENIRKYKSPKEIEEEPDIKNYPEAAQKELQELKQIIELASFFECTNFMYTMGFVIAKKLDSMSVDDIARYLGTPMEPEENLQNREDGWVYPPSSIFN